MHICEVCGQEFDQPKDIKKSTRFCCEHCRRVYIGRKSVQAKKEAGTFYSQLQNAVQHLKQHRKLDIVPGTCRFCGKECHNQNSLRNHERLCKQNPDHMTIQHTKNWYYAMEGHAAWNKGLTKETDERVKHMGETISQGYASGRIVRVTTMQRRKRLSAARLKYIEEHPDTNPYLLRKRNANTAELFFEQVFIKNSIEHVREYYILGYFLDFAFPQYKCYLEVDGEQHYWNEKQVQHDIIRTSRLTDVGWKCICRIRWSKFQKLSPQIKEKFIDGLLTKIQALT